VNASTDSIRVVGEKDLLRLARVPRGTWNAWIRNGHFQGSPTGLYGEGEVVSATVFNVLAEAIALRDAGIAWRDCGEAISEACIRLPPDGDEPLVLVVDVHALDGTAVTSASELFSVIHDRVPSPRGWIAIPIAALAREARRGFWRHAKSAADLAKDGRRKVGSPGKIRRSDPRGG
jgi:hypothetical protein